MRLSELPGPALFIIILMAYALAIIFFLGVFGLHFRDFDKIDAVQRKFQQWIKENYERK